MKPERRVWRSRMWNTVAAVFLFGRAAACGVFSVNADRAEGTTLGPALILAAAVVLILGAIRVLVVGVIVTRDGLIVRELLLTKRLSWDQLDRTDVVLGRGVRLSLFGPRVGQFVDNPAIYYRVAAGEALRTITVTALGAHRREVAEKRANEINELIRYHQDRRTGLEESSRRRTTRSRRRRVR